ncbi:MAG: sulfatase [Cyclobacteriaceae bacterium]
MSTVTGSMKSLGLLSFGFVIMSVLCSCEKKINPNPPNVVIIFLDDAGYGDFSPFDDVTVPTPKIQQLSDEGVTYTNFYVPQAVCSASRAALLSGCYPGRTRVFGAHGPNAKGLDTTFPIMSEIFKSVGYATAWFGKWHIGDQPDTRPHARGFDETAGLMYSNDMWQHHPENPDYWGKEPLKFWKNGEVIIPEVDHKHQENLTKWATESAVSFIEKNKDNPFFLYVPHSMPHVPIYASESFQGKSGQGIYGDVTMELDWSIGQINDALKRNGLEENTIVIFSSDNGPWISYGNHAGKTPFREAKGTSFDGGVRSPCIIKYPAQLDAGRKSDVTFMTIDLLPTLSQLIGIDLPTGDIDGKNVWPLLLGDPNAPNPQEYYAFSNNQNFEVIMSSDGRFKMHLPHSYRTLASDGADGIPGKYEQAKIDMSLFDLETDPYETKNVAFRHPKIANDLLMKAEKHRLKYFTEE